MNPRFSIKSNTVESDKIDNKITQFFVPSSRYSSPVVIIPTDPTGSGTLVGNITYGDLIASDNIYINTNGSYDIVILTLPPLSQILDLFQDPVQGSTRSWNIGYDSYGAYNIVSPDVVSYNNLKVQLFQYPQNVAFATITIIIYPYGSNDPQVYDIFATSISSLGNITTDFSNNIIVGYNNNNRSNNNGSENVIVGYDSAANLTSGNDNVIIGAVSGYYLTCLLYTSDAADE